MEDPALVLRTLFYWLVSVDFYFIFLPQILFFFGQNLKLVFNKRRIQESFITDLHQQMSKMNALIESKCQYHSPAKIHTGSFDQFSSKQTHSYIFPKKEQ